MIQGVITFVVVLARVLGRLIDRVLFKNKNRSGLGYWVTSLVAEVILDLLASIYSDVVFKTTRISCGLDAGFAQLVGVLKMIRALQRLKSAYHGQLLAQLSAVGINGSKGTSWIQHGFMSHPPLKERIEVLCKSA